MEKTIDRNELQIIHAEEFMDKGFFGIAYLCPRYGKIKFTLNCLSESDKVIVTYPEVNVKSSWTNDFKRWKFNGKNVKFSTHMSIKKLKDPCDVLVIDEIHRLSEAQIIATSQYIANFGIKKVIGLTGTLSEDTRLNLYAKLALPVLIEYSIEQGVRDKIITDYLIEVRTVPLSTVKNIKVKWAGGEFITSEKQSFDNLTNKLSDPFLSNGKIAKTLRLRRMGIIKKSQAKIDETRRILEEFEDKRVLVFTGLTEVADSLLIDSYHYKNKNEKVKEDFLSGLTDKLAIVNKLNIGITFKKLNTAIVNFFDSNAENMAQKISRVTCYEYDNVDKKAHIIIVTTDEEVELKWLRKALSFFHPDKIKYVN